MELNKKLLEDLAERVNSVAYKQDREKDYKKLSFYNGVYKDIMAEVIGKMFQKGETITELIDRLSFINITKKIVDKLSGVYNEQPTRFSSNDDEMDNELVQKFSEDSNLNMRQKEANKYMTLFGRNLQEIYLSREGIPKVRNIQRHNYEVFSMDSVHPERVSIVCKILKDSNDLEEQKLVWWTDESHVITNGKGDVLMDEMIAMDNPEGVNAFGVLPFVYYNTASNSVEPPSEEVLFNEQVIISLLLTDLSFGLKYQCFSILFTVGFDGYIPFNPNSVISADFGPDGRAPIIDQIKPDIDADKMMMVIEKRINYVLTTHNLSASTISSESNVQSASSGVSKMIDQAEVLADRRDQFALFDIYEKDLFYKLDILLDFWNENLMLSEDYTGLTFSEDFSFEIIFSEPKVIISEEEKINLAKLRLDNGLSSLKRELMILYPNMKEEEIEDLRREILEDQLERENMKAQMELERINGVQSEV